jgi:hypothetical protein
MKIYKRSFGSQLLVWWHQLRSYNHPLRASSSLIYWMMRRNATHHEIFGISVYFSPEDPDSTFGFELVERALKLLNESSPNSIEAFKRQIKIIYIARTNRWIRPDWLNQSCIIDPFKYLPKNKAHIEVRKTRMVGLMAALASTPQRIRLSKGRFGYFGIRHGAYLYMKTQIRVSRRCFSPDKQLAVLTEIAICYKVIDDQNLRPGRHYHPRFINQEMERLSFGKKLRLHPKLDTMVVEDEA